MIPAAPVMGGGGGGGGEGVEQPSKDAEAEPQSGRPACGFGFGGVMWPAGAFEIRDDRVSWRPAIDVTRVL